VAKIFISYNSKDRTWAQWIGVTLRDNGHVPFVHEWEISAGQNIPRWMDEKIRAADRLLAVFTDAYTKAIYSGAERVAAFWQDPEGRKGFLVPVEVETVTEWPPLTAPLKRLSLVDLNETEAETALLDFLKPPRPPDKRPPFPGKHEFADTRIDLDSVLESASEATAFTAQSEPLPDARPALPNPSALSFTKTKVTLVLEGAAGNVEKQRIEKQLMEWFQNGNFSDLRFSRGSIIVEFNIDAGHALILNAAYEVGILNEFAGCRVLQLKSDIKDEPKLAKELADIIKSINLDADASQKAISQLQSIQRINTEYSNIIDILVRLATNRIDARQIPKVAAVPRVPDHGLPKDGEPPDPRDREAFQKWLETKPREWSVVIAARAALRVLPLVLRGTVKKRNVSAILLPVFRTTAIARFAAANSARSIQSLIAARNAEQGARVAARAVPSSDESSVSAAIAARSAALAGADAIPAAAAAAASAVAAALRAAPTSFSAARLDAAALESGGRPDLLAHAALWPAAGSLATEAQADWLHLAQNLRRIDKSWEVWIDWYEEVLAGSPPSPTRSEAWEAACTDVQHPSYPWQRPLPWDNGPAAVNLAIKARLDAVQQPVAAASRDGVDQITDDGRDPQPIERVASPITITRRADGRIAAEAGAFAFPKLPPSLTPEDLARTLATCHNLAETLRSAATAPTFNGRAAYGEALGAYLDWLPADAGTGNILLADSEARVLNKLFTADEGILATGFAARLSVFLESHIGLRAHYDEVERFYQTVRTGRLEAPLQRDAVKGIKQVVHDNTPAVFDESVPPVVDETAKPVPEPAPLAPEDRPPPDPSRPKPPRDPIADVDPRKSRSFIFAAAANRIWQILLQGKDLPTALDGWHKTYEQMKPHIGPIIEWLRVTGG
jgi:TIR domain